MPTSEYMNKIVCGDSYKLIKNLDDKSVDLVIIDPPYDIYAGGSGGCFGKENRTYHGEIKPISNGVTNEILHELVRVMKKINIYIWCNKEQLRQYIDFFEDIGAKTDLLTWHKTNPIPTCCNKYLSDTEYLLFFKEKGVPLYGTYETKKKFYITDTNKMDKDKFTHPTIKPVDIIENLIINSSKVGGG